MVKKTHVDAASRQILEHLQEEYKPPQGGDGRMHQRKSWCAVLTVQFEDSTGQLTILHKVEITTHDVSRGGFGFIFNKNIRVGSHISAQFNMLPNQPIIHGEIRSSRHLCGQQYRIGVFFTNVKRGNELPQQPEAKPEADKDLETETEAEPKTESKHKNAI